MRSMLALASLLLLAPATGTAQQAKGKAPSGCIPCEELCNWCASLGLQDKDTGKCRAGCRSWGGMVGLGTVYVHKKRSLCGTGNYAPRCN